MINVYTDGSFNVNATENGGRVNIAGCGILIQFIDDGYKNEVLREEYYAYRFNQFELINMIENDEFQCFDSLTSTLAECIGFVNGFKLIKPYLDKNPYESIHFFCDDSNICVLFEKYKTLVLNGYDAKNSLDYGCYMCLLDNIFKNNIEFLRNIKISHVTAHNTCRCNNIVDYLASYRSNPNERIMSVLSKQTDFTQVPSRKEYFNHLKELF